MRPVLTDPVTGADRLELRDVVRRFTRDRFDPDATRRTFATDAGVDEASWKLMADLGWVGLAVPERFGGVGMGMAELCVVLAELGAALAPVPYTSTAAFGALALDRAGSEESRAELLPGIADGSRVAALVAGAGWIGAGRVHATGGPGGWTLTGRVPHCLDAGRADPLLVLAGLGEGGTGLFAVDPAAGGVTVEVVPGIDVTRRAADVALERAAAAALHDRPLDPAASDAVADHLAVALAADLAGQASRAVEVTLDHLRQRQQFGRAIGTFQALKHRAAELAVAVTTAGELVWAAASAADAGDLPGLSLAAPLALARSARAARLAGEEGIQLHGAIGFTDEAAIGLYYKRALGDAELLARPAVVHQRLRTLLGLGG